MIRRNVKRICLFAGYNSDEIIEDYVVYLIEKLSLISDVYYLSDNNLPDNEKSKIAPYVKAAYGFKHEKYDFGSWQELINILGWDKLSEYDELILANDSMFGPLFPFEKYFKKMENDSEWDICGINRNYDYRTKEWFLNSYFLVFKKKAYMSDIFKNHIESVEKKDSPYDVVNAYEIPFMKKFYDKGYKVKCLIDCNDHVYMQWRKFIVKGSPFLKKKIFDDDLFVKSRAYSWKNFIIKHTEYNPELIENYFKDSNMVYRDYKYLFNKKIFKDFLAAVRKWIIKINIKKNKQTVRIFGIYLVNHNVERDKKNDNNEIMIME